MAVNSTVKPMLAFTLDFETGGLECQKSACTQIAMHAVRIDTFETIGRYVMYISPYHKKDIGCTKKVLRKTTDEQPLMEYSDVALTYSAITMEMLNSQGVDIKEVAAGCVNFMREQCEKASAGRNKKPFLIGQNIVFDIGFLQQLMEYGGQAKEYSKYLRGVTDFYGNFQPTYIDTILLAQLAFANNPEVTSYTLELTAERVGVELIDDHDADADVKATTDVCAVFSRRMRNENGEAAETTDNKAEKTRTHFKL